MGTTVTTQIFAQITDINIPANEYELDSEPEGFWSDEITLYDADDIIDIIYVPSNSEESPYDEAVTEALYHHYGFYPEYSWREGGSF